MLFGAMNFPIRDLDEEAREISSLGFDYMELAMDPPCCEAWALRGRADHVRQRLSENGLGLVCHLPAFVSTADLTRRIREASLEESMEGLEVAAELDADMVVLHPAFVMGLGLLVKDLSQRYAVEALSSLIGKARALGVRVALENMFPQSGSMVTPEDFSPVMEAFPDLGIALDTGHANIQGGTERAVEFIRAYPTRICHLHASDNWGRRDDHLPLGAGTVDFRSVVAELRTIGYDGRVTFEVFSPDRDYLRISRAKFLRLWNEAPSPKLTAP